MTRQTLFVGIALLVLTILGFARFPGHTYLEQDSLIYLPIFQHLDDASVLTRDLVATRPHVSFTVYDEVTRGLAAVTRLDYEWVLGGEQFVFRFLGILGVYLLAGSLGLRMRAALLVAAVFALGATVLGPTVLTFEYEPIPRGFALLLLMMAVGCAAQGRELAAGVFGSLAFLYHPPTSCPFWLLYFVLVMWPDRPERMRKRMLGLAPLAVAVVALLVLSRLQAGVAERQDLFGRLEPWVEQLQRLRAPYDWVEVWIGRYVWHFLFLFAVAAGGFLRLRRWMSRDLKCFALGLPVIGMLGVAASWVLLDRLKWGLMSQFQPARWLLFVAAMASVMAAAAALKAAEAARWKECFGWAAAAFAVPMTTCVNELIAPGVADPVMRARLALLAVLAGLVVLAGWMEQKRPKLAGAPWLAALVAGFFLIPTFGQVQNYPDTRRPELDQLSAWAAAQTPKEAMFLFPDAGRQSTAGIFRVKARRAVYVDWKGGGQVNFLRDFSAIWWERWQKTTTRRLTRNAINDFRAMGIDYMVVKPEHRLADRAPVFENAKFVAYRLGR
jgi:hypothetical protein